MRKVVTGSVAVLLSCMFGVLLVRAGENDLEKLFRERQIRFIDFKIGPDTDYIGHGETRPKLKKSFVLVHNRLEASILRLENIASRIDGRLAALNAEGAGKEHMEDARAELREAREVLETSNIDFEELFLSNNPQDALDNIQNEINDSVIVRLQNAHKIMVAIILDIKQAEK